MDTSTTRAFAILAPVPENHLITGLDAIAQQLDATPPQTPPVVAYGSDAFEVFGKADQLRQQAPVEIYFYASHAKEQPLNHQVTWRATYIGHVHSRRGRYPGSALHRPASTQNDAPTWAIFWRIQDLEKLDTPIPIANFRALEKKTNLTARFIPEGPMLVALPVKA
ncbi:MAG: hypothetical protein ICV77_09925 [Cyanobacteria bacterium Co-bin8]|nr:hypothetical protein [Cyanobacteria bacterium Co-bin8]